MKGYAPPPVAPEPTPGEPSERPEWVGAGVRGETGWVRGEWGRLWRPRRPCRWGTRGAGAGGGAALRTQWPRGSGCSSALADALLLPAAGPHVWGWGCSSRSSGSPGLLGVEARPRPTAGAAPGSGRGSACEEGLCPRRAQAEQAEDWPGSQTSHRHLSSPGPAWQAEPGRAASRGAQPVTCLTRQRAGSPQPWLLICVLSSGSLRRPRLPLGPRGPSLPGWRGVLALLPAAPPAPSPREGSRGGGTGYFFPL